MYRDEPANSSQKGMARLAQGHAKREHNACLVGASRAFVSNWSQFALPTLALLTRSHKPASLPKDFWQWEIFSLDSGALLAVCSTFLTSLWFVIHHALEFSLRKLRTLSLASCLV